MTNEVTPLREVMVPQSFEQAVRFAEMVSKTQFVPQAFRNKPDDCLAAITYGAELGLSPMQALRGVAVINGAPAVYGDTLLAVCQSHPHWAGKKEWIEGEDAEAIAHCIVYRKGESEVHATFSVASATAAGLLGKAGPWTQYRNRMLAMRARSFALRDQFADALRGIIAVEEARDYQHIGADHAKDVTPQPVMNAAERRAAMEATDAQPEPVEAHDPATGEVHDPEPEPQSEPEQPAMPKSVMCELWKGPSQTVSMQLTEAAKWLAAEVQKTDMLGRLNALDERNLNWRDRLKNGWGERLQQRIDEARARLSPPEPEAGGDTTPFDDLEDPGFREAGAQKSMM